MAPLLDVPMLAIGSINSVNLAVFVEYVESSSLSTLDHCDTCGDIEERYAVFLGNARFE